MGLWDRLLGHIRSVSNPPMVIRIPSDQVAGGYEPRPFRVQDDYLRLWASDMLLRYDRIGPWSVTPGVQSLVVLTFGDQRQEVPGLVGPAKIARVEAKGRSGVRTERQVLTQLMPYRGGLVEIEAALLQLPGEDYFGAFMDVLGGLSEIVSLGEVSTGLDVANKLGDGIGGLLGVSGEGKLVLGWMSDFAEAGRTPLLPGYVAVLPQGSIDPAELYVSDGLLHRRSADGAERIDDVDYLLLEIEQQQARADWESLRSISKPLQRAQEYLDGGDAANAEAFFKAAIIATRQTSDLTGSDKKRAIADILARTPPGAPAQAETTESSLPTIRSLGFDTDAELRPQTQAGGLDPYSPDAADA